MKNYSNLVLLCSIYLITVLLGFNTATFILPLMYPPEGQQQVIAPVVEEPDNPASSMQIFFYIIVGTMVMLYLMKKKLEIVIKAALAFSFFTGMLFTTLAIFGDFGLLITLVLLVSVFTRLNNILLTNLALMLTISGIGAVLGASLGLYAALALLLVMAVYDIVAVFYTKHMVALAEGAKENIPLMFLVPVGDRTMGLGAGDLALPLTFCVSVLATHGVGYAIPTAYGGLLGLIALFYYIQTKEKVALPALPPIVGGLLIGYVITILSLG